MSNLFKPAKAETPAAEMPDEDQARVESLRRGRLLRGRAATMLADGQAATTAVRQVTGN